MKKVLGVGLGIVATVIAVLVLVNVATPVTQVASDRLGGNLGVKLVIEVHRKDGTVERYEKEGDLILKNFAMMLVKGIRGKNDPDNEDDYVNINGGKVSGNGPQLGSSISSGSPSSRIYLGSGTTPPTINDYKLENVVLSFYIQDADIIINGSDITIDIFGSYTLDTACNVSEVGLAFYGYGISPYWVLLFRDVLANPIQLNAGDGITVHYYIYLDNP